MDENTNNPYAAPAVDRYAKPVANRSRSMINQIRIVAICMIIQGVLELLYAAYMLVMSFVYPMIMEQTQQMQNQQIPPGQAEFMNNFQFYMTLYFATVGVLILIVGVLRLVAGILNFQYRRRKLGIAANFAGILSIATCYCLPTGIAICIYGAFIFFNQDVIKAFSMKSEGNTDSEILEYFNQ